MKRLELQTLLNFAAENVIMRTKANGLRGPVETLSCKKKEMTMLAQNVRDLTANSEKVQPDV